MLMLQPEIWACFLFKVSIIICYVLKVHDDKI